MHILFIFLQVDALKENILQLTLFILYAAIPEWYQLTEPALTKFFTSAALPTLGQQVFIQKEQRALHMLVLL